MGILAQISKPLFVLLILVSILLYIIDVGSDMYLARRYFANGDYWWGTWTTVFIVIPWGLMILVALYKADRLFVAAAMFNLLPVAFLI